MGNESKSLGITEACPECGKVLTNQLKFVGSFFKDVIKCPECRTRFERTVTISQKIIINLVKITIVFLVAVSIIKLGSFSQENLAGAL